MKKTILVCGDLVWDTHIASLPEGGRGYQETHSKTQLINRYGGAWYLADVVKEYVEANRQWLAALAGSQPNLGIAAIEPEYYSPRRPDRSEIDGSSCPSGIAKGFSVWKWHEGAKGVASVKAVESPADGGEDKHVYKRPKGEPEPGAWRVSEFLGCREADWEESRPAPAITDAPDYPDVLIIDNLGLGFADRMETWPHCLRDPKSFSGEIIIKGLQQFDSPLGRRLLDPAFDLVSRVTVIISVASLRNMGATISHRLSWDSTIEDFQREFSPGGVGWEYRKCARVVVTCGRSGAAVFSQLPESTFVHDSTLTTLQFERFVYDPRYLENIWSNRIGGMTFGTGSLMAAAFAGHALTGPHEPSGHLTVARGLAMAREQHQHGGGHDPAKFGATTPETHFVKRVVNGKLPRVFKSAYPRHLLDEPEFAADVKDQTLLTDVIGTGKLFLHLAAEDIVLTGYERVLAGVPRLECGQYYTVDREEIENLNTVRNLIEEYRTSNDPKPLSIAVFGAPGSGKSFAIKQLAEQIFGEQRATLTFNLTQFTTADDLYEAFHEVRDKSVKGQIPLVFWDEFDAGQDGHKLRWLKEFLAPMQDSEFVARGKAHPFGKCIFVFAGGTRKTFQEFDISDTDPENEFRDVKGPDFVSRLRGYVNIKGPNPVGEPEEDQVSVIRRAIMLRSLLKRNHPHLIPGEPKAASIDPCVLAAFLSVEKYKHGARSMEAIVSLSSLHGNSHFGPSQLPPAELLRLHVTSDFADIVRNSGLFRLSSKDVETLAELIHNNWWAGKMGKGYVFGPKRDDTANPPTTPLCKPYSELTETEKEANRLPARLAVLRLENLGYKIVAADTTAGLGVFEIDTEESKRLQRSEHRRWMREKLLSGLASNPVSVDDLLLHRDICKSADLPDGEPELDANIIAAIFTFLHEKNLVLVATQTDAPNGLTIPQVGGEETVTGTRPVSRFADAMISARNAEARPILASMVRSYIPRRASLETSRRGHADHNMTPEVPGGTADKVYFSVTSPPSVAGGFNHLIDIWAHLDEQRRDVLRRARMGVVGGKVNIKSKGPVKVAGGTVITVRVRIEDLEVDPLEDTILWEGEIGNAQFEVRVPASKRPGKCLGQALFLIDGIPITKLLFEILIGESIPAPDFLAAKVHRYRKVFIAYSSKDIDAVLARIQGLRKGRPDLDVFFAEAHIRPGEMWKDRLQSEIVSRDALYLFWSKAASASEYVEWEWRCALEQHGIEFIDPVPLVHPKVVPPPKELGDLLHFNDWVLAYMTGKPSKSTKKIP